MKAIKEIREERNDVISFWVDKEVISVNGSVIVEEKVDETTLLALTENKASLEAQLLLVNEKITLINALQ